MTKVSEVWVLQAVVNLFNHVYTCAVAQYSMLEAIYKYQDNNLNNRNWKIVHVTVASVNFLST